ncbi:MAG: HD domain-containing protein [Candidatus Pacebacteria bacterium]|nr:HD domain-containing protein [Candidatus Paceibacterota bacterium]
MKLDKTKIPEAIINVTTTIEAGGYEAYLVGGCVRDLLLGRTPNDWDVTTSAKPEQIQALWGEDETFYENSFGTVGVKIDANYEVDQDSIVEVTPYRTEGAYTDSRHPDKVKFSNSIHDDLKRRDFTVNAIAYRVVTDELVDDYNGIIDLNNHILKAVGDVDTRFNEDALRMIRALRLSAQLDFTVESQTMVAIANNAKLLKKVSYERIRDEFNKMVMSNTPATALGLAEQLQMLQYIIPELREGIGCEQGKAAHAYDVFEHNLRTLQHAADKELTLEERLASLFHDIGKPKSRRKKGSSYTFYGHEVIGARMTKEIMKRLKYPKDTAKQVENLVRWHMFFSDPDVVTLSAVRRMITNVGQESIQKLLRVRMCDRIGSGRPKEQPFRLRKYTAMVDEALRDPISVGMLAIDGSYIMSTFSEQPGPRLGWILHTLLEDVLDDANNNTEDYLSKRVKELLKLSDQELKTLGKSGSQKQKEADEVEVAKLRKKHHVS